MRDDGAEGLSAKGDEGQAAISHLSLIAQILIHCWIQFCLS